MVTRQDFIGTLDNFGAELESNQRVADLFAEGPHKCAPVNPFGGTFTIGDFGSIIDAVKGTCPAPRGPAIDLDKTFNAFAPPPKATSGPSHTASSPFNPKTGK